jgi:hypothetical protein
VGRAFCQPLSPDNTLIDHAGKLIDDVGYFCAHADRRHLIAHDYLDGMGQALSLAPRRLSVYRSDASIEAQPRPGIGSHMPREETLGDEDKEPLLDHSAASSGIN